MSPNFLLFKTGHVRKYITETLSIEPHPYPREACLYLLVDLFSNVAGL